MSTNDLIKVISYLTLLELSTDLKINEEQVKTAYRQLSKIYHPDLSNEKYKDGKKFIQLQEAKDYLINNLAYVNRLIASNFSTGSSHTSSNYDYEAKQREEVLELLKIVGLDDVKDELVEYDFAQAPKVCARVYEKARGKSGAESYVALDLKVEGEYTCQCARCTKELTKTLCINETFGITTDEDNDNMTVEVELAEMFTDDYGRLQQLGKDITRALKDEILLTPRVKLVPRGTLPVSEGKAVRVVDKRKVYQ
jgi:uncharacterized metal-binding protein YceD (DUF177 family)/uncharacterized protein YktA (UPF0223 family)